MDMEIDYEPSYFSMINEDKLKEDKFIDIDDKNSKFIISPRNIVIWKKVGMK